MRSSNQHPIIAEGIRLKPPPVPPGYHNVHVAPNAPEFETAILPQYRPQPPRRKPLGVPILAIVCIVASVICLALIATRL